MHRHGRQWQKREDKEKEEGGVKDEARLTERRVVGYLPIIHARDRCTGSEGGREGLI